MVTVVKEVRKTEENNNLATHRTLLVGLSDSPRILPPVSLLF